MNGWTVDTLYAHFTALLEAQDKAVKAALASAEKAVDRAEINAEKWRQNANEWRAAMTDRERNFARKETTFILAALGGLATILGLFAAIRSFLH